MGQGETSEIILKPRDIHQARIFNVPVWKWDISKYSCFFIGSITAFIGRKEGRQQDILTRFSKADGVTIFVSWNGSTLIILLCQPICNYHSVASKIIKGSRSILVAATEGSFNQ